MTTDLASTSPTVDSAAAFALIDLAYAHATAKRARHYRLDAILAAAEAGATWDQIEATVGGLEVADLLALGDITNPDGLDIDELLTLHAEGFRL